MWAKYKILNYMDDDQWQYLTTRTEWGHKTMVMRFAKNKMVCSVNLGQYTNEPDYVGWVYGFATDHRFQHQGYGRETLHHAIDLAIKLGITKLYIEPDTLALREWYRKEFNFRDDKDKSSLMVLEL